jgi:hypothetical protein
LELPVQHEIDIPPSQAEQLALPQARGCCEQNQGSFSNAQTVNQRLISAGTKTVGAPRRFAL